MHMPNALSLIFTGVSLKHDGTDGTDGTVKVASLCVPSVSVRRDLENGPCAWPVSQEARLLDTGGTGKQAFFITFCLCSKDRKRTFSIVPSACSRRDRQTGHFQGPVCVSRLRAMQGCQILM